MRIRHGAEGCRVFIPVKVKDSGGFDARSSLATLEQMGQMQRHIELLLRAVASSLHGGQIRRTAVGRTGV